MANLARKLMSSRNATPPRNAYCAITICRSAMPSTAAIATKSNRAPFFPFILCNSAQIPIASTGMIAFCFNINASAAGIAHDMASTVLLVRTYFATPKNAHESSSTIGVTP
ncbi:MAG TPA: hypothetical protein IAC19_06295 [Candidatus Ventricola gallistercoris]|nr:hypothetical protein [Candidatus Ventricola gallistercoris]